MEKILFALLLLLLYPVLSPAQARLGVTGSFGLAGQRINASNQTLYAGENVKSYSAGLTGDVPLSQHWYLQPQLLYSRKGAVHLHSTGEPEQRIRIDYIEAPLSVLYKAELPFGKLFAGGGVTCGYGIGGTVEESGRSGGLYDGDALLKRFDLRLRWTGGVEFGNGLFVNLHSEKSLANLSNAEGVSLKNRAHYLSVGCLF